MAPQKLSLQSFTEGDQWEGIPALSIRVNGLPPATALALVTIRFKPTQPTDSAVVQLSSATAGQITILSAANWEITVPPQIVAGLTKGLWNWRMRFTDTSPTGSPKTYLADQITVLETI